MKGRGYENPSFLGRLVDQALDLGSDSACQFWPICETPFQVTKGKRKSTTRRILVMRAIDSPAYLSPQSVESLPSHQNNFALAGNEKLWIRVNPQRLRSLGPPHKAKNKI